MARAPGLWLAAAFCFHLCICYSKVDGLPQGSIIRAKRELDDDFQDALYAKEDGLLSKREAIGADDEQPSEAKASSASESVESEGSPAKKSDAGDKVTIDSAESIEAQSNEAGKSDNGEESKKDDTQSKTETFKDEKAETRHNVEGKNADSVSKNLLKSGMDSNVDNPMTNSDLIKKYDAAEDTSNGELLGMSKRTKISTGHTETTARSETKKDIIDEETTTVVRPTTTKNTENNLSKRQTIESPKLTKRSEKETHDIQEAGAPSHFQVDDKSADLEINANSAGVKVKAKPASLQVVSRPGQHGIAPPMMPFMPPPVPVMHHLPHHHRHHHHHHRRHHYIEPIYFAPFHHEGFTPYGHSWGHEGGYGWEDPHFFAPYHHDEGYGGYGHWGEGDGFGFHGYARHRIEDAGLYGRSTVETARDPRLSAPAALDGFNSGIALPDMDQRFMRIGHLNGPQVRYQHLDDDFKGYGPPTMEEERLAEQGEYRYHVPRAPLPEMEGHHHHEQRLKRRLRPMQEYQDYIPNRPRYAQKYTH